MVKQEPAAAIISALVSPVFPIVFLPERDFLRALIQQNHRLFILHSTVNLAVLFLYNATINHKIMKYLLIIIIL